MVHVCAVRKARKVSCEPAFRRNTNNYMAFEERMEQLGRRALEQEPPELALPRCIRAAECVKPISCVKYRIQENACDASRTQQQLDKSSSDSKPAHKAATGKLLRSSQQQAQQQLDALKARRSAAKAFSALVERRNAEQLDFGRPRRSAGTPPPPTQAHTGSCSSATPHLVSSTGSFHQQPCVERHIPPRRSDAAPAPAEEQCCSSATAASAVPDTAMQAADAAAEQPALAGDTTAAAHCCAVSAPGREGGSEADVVPPSASAAVYAPFEQRSCKTFLTDPDSQPASPLRAPAMAAAPAASDGAAFPGEAGAALLAMAEKPAAAAAVGGMELSKQLSGKAAGAGMQQPKAAAGGSTPACPSCGLFTAACSETTRASSVACCMRGKQRQGLSIDSASSRLLCYAHITGAGDEPGWPAPPQQATVTHAASQRMLANCMPASSAAAQTPSHAQGSSTSVEWASLSVACNAGASSPNRTSSPQQHPSSCGSRSCQGPHWGPVAPQFQPQPPAVVQQPMMATWVVDQEPLLELPPQQRTLQLLPQAVQQRRSQETQQQQQQPLLSSISRPPCQGVKGNSSSATFTALQSEPSSKGSTSNRRASNTSAAGRLRGKGSRSSSTGGAAPDAAFSSPELVQLVAAAADKVSKHHLVLPCLCSCGHGTSVLDASYIQHCCSNCPLRGDPAAYEQLLSGLLAGMNLV